MFDFRFIKYTIFRRTNPPLWIIPGTGLSVQQLEALVKMKPTKEEEEKLLDYDGDTNMLEPAENFVRALLTIPMAFSRIETMLYKETFEDEVAHLRTSFSIINVNETILSNLQEQDNITFLKLSIVYIIGSLC
jgi:hypothetical protein